MKSDKPLRAFARVHEIGSQQSKERVHVGFNYLIDRVALPFENGDPRLFIEQLRTEELVERLSRPFLRLAAYLQFQKVETISRDAETTPWVSSKVLWQEAQDVARNGYL